MRFVVPANHARWLRVHYAIGASLCAVAAVVCGSVAGGIVLGCLAAVFARGGRGTLIRSIRITERGREIQTEPLPISR